MVRTFIINLISEQFIYNIHEGKLQDAGKDSQKLFEIYNRNVKDTIENENRSV